MSGLSIGFRLGIVGFASFLLLISGIAIPVRADNNHWSYGEAWLKTLGGIALLIGCVGGVVGSVWLFVDAWHWAVFGKWMWTW